MVYDAATRQLLLFGGSRLIGTAGGFYGDTWIWTGFRRPWVTTGGSSAQLMTARRARVTPETASCSDSVPHSDTASP
jgi:hypothetical protein